MTSAKKLGFKKGDFIHTGLFPGIIIGDAHTSTPLCEVWGIECEIGSAYATDLKHISFNDFQVMVRHYNPGMLDIGGSAYSEISKKAIQEAEIKATA